MIVKCSCGKPECTIQLRFEDAHHCMITDRNGKEHMMYLDANGTVELIKAGRVALEQMSTPPKGEE